MAKLTSLNFVQLPTLAAADPVLHRRQKLSSRLQQQRSLVEDPNFVIKTQKWIPDADGVKQLVQKQKRVRPWWRTDVTGNVVLTVRYGARPIEFSKGKSAIAVGTKDKLLGVIDVIIGAALAGELDSAIGLLSKATEFNKGKRAA